MSKDLVVKKDDLAKVIDKKGLSGTIKPLTKEIHLFDTFIAGTTYLEDHSPIDELKVGDMLLLQREDNRYDDNAILVLNKKKKKLGYVPQKDNIVFARLMNAGKLLQARVLEIDDLGDFTQIKIGIYLVDF